LDKIIKYKNIINFGRVQGLGWYGHIERMQETRMVKTIHPWKLSSKRPMRTPMIRWEDDVKKDVQRLKVPNWKTFVQDRRNGRKWLRRPKLCTKSCRAALRRSVDLRTNSDYFPIAH